MSQNPKEFKILFRGDGESADGNALYGVWQKVYYYHHHYYFYSNHVSTAHTVAAVLYLQSMLHVMLFRP
jgi:hypothetical protein